MKSLTNSVLIFNGINFLTYDEKKKIHGKKLNVKNPVTLPSKKRRGSEVVVSNGKRFSQLFNILGYI